MFKHNVDERGGFERKGPLLLDVLAAGHGVPHARARQDVHVVDDDKRLFFQRDDGQVVLVGILVSVRVVPGPHGEHQRQGSVLPAAHLQENQAHMQTAIRDLCEAVFAFPLMGLSPRTVLLLGGRAIVFVRKLFAIVILPNSLFRPHFDLLNIIRISINLQSEAELVKHFMKYKNENLRH